jgi:carbamoyltransferase
VIITRVTRRARSIRLPFQEAAILTIDGVGEWATSSIGIGKGSELALLKELRFPR